MLGIRLDAWEKCVELVHWEDPEGSGGEGGGRGIGMGNTCKSMAYSCQCMTKTTIKKKKKNSWYIVGAWLMLRNRENRKKISFK